VVDVVKVDEGDVLVFADIGTRLTKDDILCFGEIFRHLGVTVVLFDGPVDMSVRREDLFGSGDGDAVERA
jgi:hypothetical protein